VPGADPGPVIDGVTLIEVLDERASSTCYLADKEGVDGSVEITVLHDDVPPRAWRRFRHEARRLATLTDHPHLVTIRSGGRTRAGEPYLVTDHLDRGTLADVLARQGPLGPQVLGQVAEAIASALAAVHGLGIVHGAVAPEAVRLDRDGRIALGDFGLATLLPGPARASLATQAVSGSFEAGPADVAADVGGLAATIAAAISSDRLPHELVAVLRAALDPDPRRRPTLAVVRSALAALRAESEFPAHTVDPTTSATEELPVVRTAQLALAAPHWADVPERRRPSRAAVLVVAALFLVGCGIALAIGQRDEAGTTSPAISTPEPVTPRPSTVAPGPVPTVTSAPVPATPSPSTVAPGPVPTATSAPVPAAPPASSAPPPPAETAAPPPSPPADTTALPPPPPPTDATEPVITQAAVDAFVRGYYDAVAVSDYSTSSSLLAPEFQRGKARSYEYYTGFWDDNDIEIGAVELVAVDGERVVAHVELRWNGSDTTLVDAFTLRPGDDGGLLIAAQRSVGR